MRGIAVAVLAMTSMIAGSGAAQIPRSKVTKAELWFDAKATLGAFRGTTREATGEIGASPTLAGVHGFVEMKATSLATGNGLRDSDMRKTLEVEKFPIIRFDLDSVTVRGESGDSTSIDLVGRMTIHGVTRPIRIPAHLRRQQNELRVTGAYDLHVPDYGVTKLKRMLGALSMNPNIRVGIDITFTAA